MAKTQKQADAQRREFERRQAALALETQRRLKAQCRFVNQTTTITPRSSSPASLLSSMLGPSLDRSLVSADMECAHGRLPSDSSPDCGCWRVAA